MEKFKKTEEEWRQQLSPEQYHVARQKGTEPAFTGKYWDNHEEGTYRCACCGAELFDSATKFDSGTGWPSFYAAMDPNSVRTETDTSHGMRRVEAQSVFDLMRRHRVTHYCGAPVVHNMLVNAPGEMRAGIPKKIFGMIAGSAPPPAVIESLEQMGVDLTHVYGLTEVYGPASVCAKHPEWETLSPSKRAELNARQGVRYEMQESMTVLDPKTMQPVPRDGETMGEIMFRGNIMMKGYLKNPRATSEAFAGGWFHTGDLAVSDRDGYVKIKDRSKDIIISGGENISTIEIEDVLYSHPAVLEAAVVASPDEKWGETPCAFIVLKSSSPPVTEKQVIAFCRERLAHFKCPRRVIFGSLPKTSTGKIQKNILRDLARKASQ